MTWRLVAGLGWCIIIWLVFRLQAAEGNRTSSYIRDMTSDPRDQSGFGISNVDADAGRLRPVLTSYGLSGSVFFLKHLDVQWEVLRTRTIFLTDDWNRIPISLKLLWPQIMRNPAESLTSFTTPTHTNATFGEVNLLQSLLNWQF